MATLSQKDKLILGALFDSESSPSNVAPVDPTSTTLPGISSNTLRSLQDRETQAIRPLNRESPEKEVIEKAIAELTALIQENPDYASVYNNRAQAIRMLVGDDVTSPAAAQSTLYSDLSRACILGRPSNSPHAMLSPLQAKILASAHTHRGHLILKASRVIHEAPEKSKDLPQELRGLDRDALERMAGKDFQQGGMYGNPIARQMAVQLNPYAKMCGEIVKEAMKSDIREYYQGTAVMSQNST